MKIMKIASGLISLGSMAVGLVNKMADLCDRMIHRRAYEEAARRATVRRIVLGIVGGVVAVLLFPYKLVIEKNGDFEVRSLLVKVSRRTVPVPALAGEDAQTDMLDEEQTEQEMD